MMEWTVMGMVLVTFGIRFVLFARAEKVMLPTWMEGALRFVPVSVLAAIIMPMMLLPSPAHELSLTWKNPWLLGGMVAFVLGLGFKRPLVTIVGGVLAFFIAKWLIT